MQINMQIYIYIYIKRDPCNIYGSGTQKLQNMRLQQSQM